MAINIHKIYDRRRIWKIAFFVVSLFLVVAFILISNNLVDDVAVQERERMQIWADATKELTTVNSSGMNTDVDFLFSIIESNHSIPVLLVDDHGNILLHRNFTASRPTKYRLPTRRSSPRSYRACKALPIILLSASMRAPCSTSTTRTPPCCAGLPTSPTFSSPCCWCLS